MDALDFNAFPNLGASFASETTIALRAAITASLELGAALHLREGVYTIDGGLAEDISRARASLDLRLLGAVDWVVVPTAAHFECVLPIHSIAPANHSITGGRLRILANGRARRGIVLASAVTSSVPAGSVVLRGVEVHNVHADLASAHGVAQGVLITGPYARYDIADLLIDGVTRDSTFPGGECKGLKISQARSPVYVRKIEVRNILHASVDADGIAIFGDLADGEPACPLAVVEDCTFQDCQGRSIKTQTARTEVLRPTIGRQHVVSIAEGVDVDAQYGSLVCSGWRIEYRRNNSVSPLGVHHVPFVVQALHGSSTAFSRIGPGMLLTEVAMPNLLFINVGSQSPRHHIVVEGAAICAEGALSTSAVTRGLVEYNQLGLQEATTSLAIEIRDTIAPNDVYLLTYGSGTQADMSQKLEVYLERNRNVLPTGGSTYIFAGNSGVYVGQLSRYVFGPNPGYGNIPFDWTLDLTNGAILPGNDFTVRIEDTEILGGPVDLPTSGWLRVETGAMANAGSLHVPRSLTYGDGELRWYSRTGDWISLP